jgi:hypothetical protein
MYRHQYAETDYHRHHDGAAVRDHRYRHAPTRYDTHNHCGIDEKFEKKITSDTNIDHPAELVPA